MFFIVLNMSDFVPKKVYLWEILLHYFIQKKSAAETHRILVETYSDHALLEIICRDWFKFFKFNDFDVEDKEKVKEKELEALLHEESRESQTELAESLGVDHTTVLKQLKALGMI